MLSEKSQQLQKLAYGKSPTKGWTIFFALLLSAGCSSTPKAPSSADPADAANEPVTNSQVAELRTLVTQLQGKIDSLEGKLSAIGGKVETLQTKPIASPTPPKLTPVVPHPTHGAGTSISAKKTITDPEYGFINDDAVELYRKSLTLLHALKHSEAVLSFASFLEQFPDHPLAGSAQFHIGEAYFRQKEYKLALHEFRRVLTSYDRSPHVSETLQLMIEAEEILRLPQEAAKHRQQLTSLFPQSPAAAGPPARENNIPTNPDTLDQPPPTAPSAAEQPQKGDPLE